MRRQALATVGSSWHAPGGYREAVGLAVPITLSLLFQTCVWVIDTAFLGRLGTTAQGAAGLAEPFLWTLLLLCAGIGTGVNIRVAQLYGARCWQHCGVVTWQGLYLTLLAWLLLLVCGAFVRPLVQLGNPAPDLLEPATVYLRLRLLGALPLLLSFTLQGFFRGIGDTRTPLRVTALVSALNVLLDYLLIFGYGGFPRLEIAGAAVAAVVAASVGSCLYVWLFLRRALQQGFLGQALVPFDRQECRGLLRLSGPVGCQGALETGTWLLFATLVGRLGSAEMAAHHIATNVLTLSYMASYGVAVAATTLVGQYLGAGDHAAARRSVRSCLVLVSVLTGVMGVSFLLWRCELVWVFNHDPAVVRLSVQLLVCIALFQGFDGLALVAAGVLRGAGDTRWPMLASLVFGWGVFIPLAYLSIFPLRGGVVGGWRAAMLHILLLSVTMTARLARGQWQQSRPPQAGPP